MRSQFGDWSLVKTIRCLTFEAGYISGAIFVTETLTNFISVAVFFGKPEHVEVYNLVNVEKGS